MHVLVVEDNPKMSKALAKGLGEHGYVVTACATGLEGEEAAAATAFDLIVLDRMLPDRDGIEVCRGLRDRRVATPVLMLTALARTDDTIRGLEAGADDYLAKPFDFEVLVARVRALLRRGQASGARRLRFDAIELDLDRREATRDGERIRLTAKEFALLECLLRRPGMVLTRRAIAEKVWGIMDEPSSNVIDVVISALRRKIDRDFAYPLIHTEFGVGYRLEGREAPADDDRPAVPSAESRTCRHLASRCG